MKKQLMTLIILLAVAGLLVGGIFIAKSITERQSNAPINDEKTYCFQIDQNKITKINFAFSINEELTLEKDAEGTWHLSDEPERKLNLTKVKTLLNSLEEIPYEQEIKDADIHTYGLDNPTNVVRITADGKEYTFTFGPMTAMQTHYYMLFDGHVYTVDPFETTVFDKKRTDFYDESELVEEEESEEPSAEEQSGEAEAENSSAAESVSDGEELVSGDSFENLDLTIDQGIENIDVITTPSEAK